MSFQYYLYRIDNSDSANVPRLAISYVRNITGIIPNLNKWRKGIKLSIVLLVLFNLHKVTR